MSEVEGIKMTGRISLDGDRVIIGQKLVADRLMSLFGQDAEDASVTIKVRRIELVGNGPTPRSEVTYKGEADFAGSVKIGGFTLAELLEADFGFEGDEQGKLPVGEKPLFLAGAYRVEVSA